LIKFVFVHVEAHLKLHANVDKIQGIFKKSKDKIDQYNVNLRTKMSIPSFQINTKKLRGGGGAYEKNWVFFYTSLSSLAWAWHRQPPKWMVLVKKGK